MPSKRELLKATGAGLASVSLAGCSQLTGGGEDKFQVGVVFPVGGTGDQGFADSANRGAQKAVEELGVGLRTTAPDEVSGYKVLQRRFAQSTDPDFDLICCIGVRQQSALNTVSGNNPDQNFMIVDGVVNRDNVANYLFKEHEGSFQAGHLAGLLTSRALSAGGGETNPDNKRVGFVGGDDIPLILKFQAGYEAGVAHADDEVDVNVAFAGSFNDPSAGKELAISMYDDGADIVYHAAASTGAGVFQAARDRGRYAIGVDQPQSTTYPEFSNVILGSNVKRVNRAVFSAIKSAVNGQFKGGTTQELGLDRGGMEFVYGKDLGSAIPSEVKSAVESSRQKIIDGEISVPKEP